ncbi:hypothetical protein BELL_1692g00010 [Botrytis elliptica]|uniref:Uncharacterized protein n=1 Tax=Botrytis elliptica TaxID=278938 RepID=A0A4Z1I5X4_9HELO|nr:hypothetical protein BELL_1692g00010 [Botrytis elliptica]
MNYSSNVSWNTGGSHDPFILPSTYYCEVLTFTILTLVFGGGGTFMMSFYVTGKPTWIIIVAVRCGCDGETMRQQDSEDTLISSDEISDIGVV